MVKYAEAECATCSAIRPKHEMRQIKLERISGRSFGDSSSRRHGSRQSWSGGNSGRTRYGNGASDNSRSGATSRTFTKVERVWVCKGCRAPRSDGWFGKVVTRLAIVVIAVWVVIAAIQNNDTHLKKNPQSKFVSTRKGEQANAKSLTNPESSLPEKPAVVFAPRQEVVQSIPESKEGDYPPCSETVTDHCTGK